jgi:uncharacterized protein (UPF0276 family)
LRVNAPPGCGIGIRRQHFAHLLEHGPTGVDWMEVISENLFEPGGRPWAVYERVRREVPVAMHGVSMAIGNADPVPKAYLQRLQRAIDRLEPACVSDHLCWGGFGGHYAHDLLPLPYTEEALRHVVARVSMVQDVLRRQILLENPSSYVRFAESTLSEADFLVAVAEQADCGILLDINNVYVSSQNHHFSATQYIEKIPTKRVGYLHLAGFTDRGWFLLDSHIGPVPDCVWGLYQHARAHLGPLPVLVEWDEAVPSYTEVVAQCERARP